MTEVMELTGASALLRCPITSLCFLKGYLICGEGSFIHIFNAKLKKCVLSVKVFHNSRVHKIKVLRTKQLSQTEELSSLLLLGGKCALIVTLRCDQEVYAESCKNVTVKQGAKLDGCLFWIWDGHAMDAPLQDSVRPKEVLLLSAHNLVYQWNTVTNSVSVMAACSEQCILYSGYFFVDGCNELIVAAGTVFNKILLWKPLGDSNNRTSYEQGTVEVWKTLHGHEGVIFSITSDVNSSRLLSVSDDRSIRLWDITSEQCVQTLYGHAARVWRAQFLHNFIVSVGEDACCLVWNESGEVVKKFRGHRGKSIWSLAVTEKGSLIATGGGDGSLRLWHLSSHVDNANTVTIPLSTRQACPLPEMPNAGQAEVDKPRAIAFLSRKEIVAVTERGVVLLYYFTGIEGQLRSHQKTILSDPAFASYCSMTVNKRTRLIVLGSLCGKVRCVRLDKQEDVPPSTFTFSAFEGKIFGIFLSPMCCCLGQERESSYHLVASGPDGLLKHWVLSVEDARLSIQHGRQCRLPFSRQRWATAINVVCGHCTEACPEDQVCPTGSSANEGGVDLLVCGDRRGSVHVFGLSSKDTGEAPLCSFIGVHGKTGVTHLLRAGSFLFSTGRDGAYQKMRTSNGVHLLERKRVCKGMDWIEGLRFFGDDLLIYGFYMQAYFAIWSVKRHALIFKVQCGGGYRAWDFMLDEKDSSGQLFFAYLKGTDLKISQASLATDKDDVILKDSLHGREITCVALLPTSVDEGRPLHLFMTGSEDTTLLFQSLDSIRSDLQSVYTLEGHIGGVKSVACLPLRDADSSLNARREKLGQATADQFLLFTCGSRTSLKCWKISVFKDKNHALPDDVETCISRLSIESRLEAEIGSSSDVMKRKRRMEVLNELDDLRFMSIDVISVRQVVSTLGRHICKVVLAAACSDGVFRLYGYDDTSSQFTLVAESPYHQRCVLVSKFLLVRTPGGKIRLLATTAGTDGRIAIWDMTDAVLKYSLVEKDNEDGEQESGDSDVKENKAEEGTSQVSRPHEHFFLGSALNSTTPLLALHADPLLEVRGHQSGVNDLEVRMDDTGRRISVLSCGDDASIQLAVIQVECSCSDVFSLSLLRQSVVKSAHLSAVTGVKWISDSMVVSCSIDQWIRLWKVLDNVGSSEEDLKVENDLATSSLEEKCCLRTDVADVSSMACFTTQSHLTLIICGIGLEIFRLERCNLS